MKKEKLIGRSIVGFKYESTSRLLFKRPLEFMVGKSGIIVEYDSIFDAYGVEFGFGSHWYPADQIENYLVPESQTSNNYFSDFDEKLKQEVAMAELRGEAKKITIDESISLLESAISRMMNFESTSDKNDFLLDVVKEYKQELSNPNARSEEFAELTKPLIKYLNDKQDPHTKIIIDCTSAEMVKGELGFSTNEYVND